jgi:serine protease Do
MRNFVSVNPINAAALRNGFHLVRHEIATPARCFITDDGYLISNYHVVKDATKVRLLTSAGLIDAKVVQVDAANDLALLKADGRFAPLPIAASRTAALWAAVGVQALACPGGGGHAKA